MRAGKGDGQVLSEMPDQFSTMSTIHAINKAITANLDINLILDELLENIVTQLGMDAAAVLLFDDEAKTFRFERGKGFRTDLMKQVRVISGKSLAHVEYGGKKKFVIPDLRSAGSSFDNKYKNIYGLSDSYLVDEEGFVSYINIPLVGRDQLLGILELFSRSRLTPNKLWLNALNAVTGQAAVALYSANQFRMVQLAHEKLSNAYEVTIEGWARALDYRDHETEGHSRRVCTNTMTLASIMGINGGSTLDIRRGALLHDIGKLGIPDKVLLKHGKLNPRELGIMRRHPEIGAEMLRPIEFLNSSIDIPYCHHEKWDGTGYPSKLKGEDIPLSARVFAIIDVWDALCSDRPYREALPEDEAISIIKKGKGKHFDPRVLEAFMDTLSDGRIIYEAVKNSGPHIKPRFS